MSSPTTVLNQAEMARALRRMSHELLELTDGADDLVLLGVLTRGVPLAHRIAAEIGATEGAFPPVGELDITLYRDDLRLNPTRPVGRTHVPCPVDGAVVVLVDDVLNSGRTAQAALQAVADLGRPRLIRLVALVDRGLRELPIQADVVGRSIPTSRSERVRVCVLEHDGVDEVLIDDNPEGSA